jgi:1-deoxy-D-xylulose-5-phosphate synthase
MVLPDKFQNHDAPDRQYIEAGLDAGAIAETVLAALGRSDDAAAVVTRFG